MKIECNKKLLTKKSFTNYKSGVFVLPNLCYGQLARTQQLVNISHKLISIYNYCHTLSHFLLKLTKTCSPMASSLPNQFYSDFTFSGEISSQFHGGSSSCPDILALSNYVDEYGSFNTSSNQDSIFVPQFHGIFDVPLPEYNNYYQKMSVNNVTQYYHGGEQDQYYGFSPEIKPLFRASTGEQSWGNNEGGIVQAEANTKVGRYTVEERKDRIMRYLKKKNQRNFNKTIKYVCRKTLADRRVRVRGRFARNNDTCHEQQSPISKNQNNHSEKDEDMFSGSDDYLINMDNDDRWLHEAMSNLISFPCELEAPAGDFHHPNTWSF